MTTKALERQGAARSRLALTAAQMLPGDLANSKILGRDVAVWVFAP
jgi:hypothetical protein